MRERRRRSIENEQLVPAGRRDERVRRGGHRTRVTLTGELGEDRPSAHGVAVRGRRGWECIQSEDDRHE